MKNKFLIVASLLTFGCLVLVMLSSQRIDKARKEIDTERYNRMVAEEKLEKALSRVKTLETEITNAQNQAQNIQTVLEQQATAASHLKAELEKETQAKKQLENQLKSDSVELQSPQPPVTQ